MKPSDCEDIWHWFGLSYSAYLVLPRAVMCAMPKQWQYDFLVLLDELEATFDTDKFPGDYMVKAKKNGKFIKDPFSNYKRCDVEEFRK